MSSSVPKDLKAVSKSSAHTHTEPERWPSALFASRYNDMYDVKAPHTFDCLLGRVCEVYRVAICVESAHHNKVACQGTPCDGVTRLGCPGGQSR